MGQYISREDLKDLKDLKDLEDLGKNINSKDIVIILLFGILLCVCVIIKIEFSKY
jgi:hypothetical protein